MRAPLGDAGALLGELRALRALLGEPTVLSGLLLMAFLTPSLGPARASGRRLPDDQDQRGEDQDRSDDDENDRFGGDGLLLAFERVAPTRTRSPRF